eukprot:COSAG01_NODE_10530_length_2138_cov_4.527710_4_plen_73_part_01
MTSDHRLGPGLWQWKDNKFGNNEGMVKSRLRSIERIKTSPLDEGLRVLAEKCTQLTEVSIYGCSQVTDEGVCA